MKYYFSHYLPLSYSKVSVFKISNVKGKNLCLVTFKRFEFLPGETDKSFDQSIGSNLPVRIEYNIAPLKVNRNGNDMKYKSLLLHNTQEVCRIVKNSFFLEDYSSHIYLSNSTQYIKIEEITQELRKLILPSWHITWF